MKAEDALEIVKMVETADTLVEFIKYVLNKKEEILLQMSDPHELANVLNEQMKLFLTEIVLENFIKGKSQDEIAEVIKELIKIL